MELIVLTSGISWTAPYDWNSFNNHIYLIGGGGGGSGSASDTNKKAGGAGGGGGAYTKLTNVTLTPGVSYTIAIGPAGTAGTAGGASSTAGNGGNTTFNDGTNTYTANGGIGGSTTTATLASTGGAGGTAQSVSGLITQAYAGGRGGDGGIYNAVTTYGQASGGGGGAGGPNGIGGAGGSCAANTGSGIGGGGGGGNGGGTAGSTSTDNNGVNGGNNSLGTGAGTGGGTGGNGSVGGGGGGSNGGGSPNKGGNGGNGVDITSSYGSGGGAGGMGNGNNTNTATAGLYGGGGSGGPSSNIAQTAGIAGAQGVIIIIYYPKQSGYTKDDPVFGTIDLDDQYVTDSWLVDKYVGGTLFMWGRNDTGQLGNGNRTYYSSPVQVGALTSWKQISSTQNVSQAIKTDGTLWYWGNGGNGQSGLGFTTGTNYSSPVQVGALTNWKQVSAASLTILAVKQDGALWGWGNNQWGQIGNGNVSLSYSSPIQVGSLTNWKQVSATYFNTAAVKQDGTLWVWGWNVNGSLGINGGTNATYYSSPVQVGSLTNWKQIMNFGYGMSAIKTDGTLWTWGANSSGQLGIGNTAYYSSPIQVGSLNNWKQVTSSGDSFATLAIKTDGTLWAWGDNRFGQLGIGNTAYYSSPIQVGSLNNWKQVSAGGGTNAPQILAIKTDGTLWSWGAGEQGQLGNVTRSYYSSPIQIGSLTNWKFVSAGAGVSAAITFADLT